MAARQGQRQVEETTPLSAVPRLSAEAQTQESALGNRMRLMAVNKMNEMIADAQRYTDTELPRIDPKNFSLTILDDGKKVVVQSAGFIFSANLGEDLGEGRLTIYGKGSKVVVG